MKFEIVTTALLVGWSLGLMSYIHTKRKIEIQLNKTNYFEHVRYEITKDVMKEFKEQLMKNSGLVQQIKIQVEKLKGVAKQSQENADKKKIELNTCNNGLTQLKTGAAAKEKEIASIKNEFQQKKTTLTKQRDNLKKEEGEKSKVCNYVDKTSPEGTSLCGIAVVPAETKKEEAPKKA